MANSVQRLNWLRASVLGANDGIISTAGLVLGIAGATNSSQFILIGGLAGIIAGIISMSIGEYVSVSSLRDTEKAVFKISAANLTSPLVAAFASARAFFLGSLVPLIAILIPPLQYRIYATFASVILALAITGYVSAIKGETSAKRSVIRVVLGGAFAMTITYAIGKIFAISGI